MSYFKKGYMEETFLEGWDMFRAYHMKMHIKRGIIFLLWFAEIPNKHMICWQKKKKKNNLDFPKFLKSKTRGCREEWANSFLKSHTGGRQLQLNRPPQMTLGGAGDRLPVAKKQGHVRHS